eukprot:1163344_1
MHSSYHLSIIHLIIYPSVTIYHYPIIYPIIYPSFDDTPNGNRPRGPSPLTHEGIVYECGGGSITAYPCWFCLLLWWRSHHCLPTRTKTQSPSSKMIRLVENTLW